MKERFGRWLAIGREGAVLWCLVLPLLFLPTGCRKKDSQPASPPGKHAAATFTRDVAPILWKNCAPCHRDGEAAPFQLITYTDAAKRAQQIAEVTQSGYMPPWMPERNGMFKGERHLSAHDLAVLAEWARSGAPEGDPKDLPPVPTWPSGWRLGSRPWW